MKYIKATTVAISQIFAMSAIAAGPIQVDCKIDPSAMAMHRKGTLQNARESVKELRVKSGILDGIALPVFIGEVILQQGGLPLYSGSFALEIDPATYKITSVVENNIVGLNGSQSTLATQLQRDIEQLPSVIALKNKYAAFSRITDKDLNLAESEIRKLVKNTDLSSFKKPITTFGDALRSLTLFNPANVQDQAIVLDIYGEKSRNFALVQQTPYGSFVVSKDLKTKKLTGSLNMLKFSCRADRNLALFNKISIADAERIQKEVFAKSAAEYRAAQPDETQTTDAN